MTRLRSTTVAALLAAAALPLDAHHGAAAYDLTAPVALAATITRFEWRNPHALIDFTAGDDGSAAAQWTAETAGLIILNRAGWTRNSLEPGDRVTIVGFRARNGSNSMILQRVVLADGRELNNFVPR
jgi:hypothetical protein